MRIDLYTGTTRAYSKAKESTAGAKGAEEALAAEKEAATKTEELLKGAEKNRDQIMISTTKEKKNPYAAFYMAQSENKFNVSTGKPSDSSSQLTKRLVNAVGDFEVRMVMSQASSSMINLRIIAALGEPEDKEKAKAILAKLEKLIGRAQKKLRDLSNESALQRQKVKSEQKKQTRRTEEIKEELRSRQRVRMARENGYLLEATQQIIIGLSGEKDKRTRNTNDRLDTATEAQIAILAEVMAVAEVSAESVGGGGDVGTEVGGEGVATGEAGADPGGGDVDAAVGGGVDTTA